MGLFFVITYENMYFSFHSVILFTFCIHYVLHRCFQALVMKSLPMRVQLKEQTDVSPMSWQRHLQHLNMKHHWKLPRKMR